MGRAGRIWFLVTAALIGFATSYGQRLVDNDLFGHLAFGHAALAAGHVLKSDPYAYVPHAAVWYNHEWLWEVGTWWLYSVFGDTSLLLLKATFGAVTFIALAEVATRRGGHPGVVLVVLAAAGTGMGHFISVRPYVATYALYPVCLGLMEWVPTQPRRAVPALWLLFMVWANLHAAFVVGLGSVAIYAAVAWVQREREAGRAYALAGLGGVVAACVNPYGVAYWPFVVQAVTMKRNYITEFQPVPWAIPPSHDPFLWYKGMLLVVALALLVCVARRTPLFWPGVLLLLITAKMSVSSQRHVVLFLITAAAFLPALIGPRPLARFEWLARWDGRWIWPVSCLSACVCVALVLNQGAHMIVATAPTPVSDDYFPYNAVRFMKVNGLHGRVAVWFDWGEFLIWEMPDCQVSFDGRLETIYPTDIIDQNRAFLQDGDLGLLDRYPTDLVLLRPWELDHRIPTPTPAYLHLRERKDWHEVYRDPGNLPGACIFVRTSDQHASYLLPRPGLDPLLVPLTGPPSVFVPAP